jgi:hypothetical protein
VSRARFRTGGAQAAHGAKTRKWRHPLDRLRTDSANARRTSNEVARNGPKFDADRFTLKVASRRRRTPNVVVGARNE